MAAPVCPPGYTCTFNPPDLPGHVYDPWWTGPWGIVAGGACIVAFVICVWICAYYWNERRSARQSWLERKEARANDLAMQEQRTMQLDAAKGNPEMLKMVREMQR